MISYENAGKERRENRKKELIRFLGNLKTENPQQKYVNNTFDGGY